MNTTVDQNLLNLVSIGIATKDRWQDLEITLNKIIEAKLESIAIIIYDDNSQVPCPFDIDKFNLNIQLKRFNESQGYITRRNQLAQAIQTKYYLSLDDDSFPVSGSLETAVKFAESLDDLLCLSFPIYNPVIQEYQNQSLYNHPYQVRSFIGCGHLLHRERFLEMGGYRQELIHQGEEMEIAARAFQKSLHCYHYPDLMIYHTASNIGRNWHRMDFYGARNNVLWNDWFVPKQIKIIKQFRTFISRSYLGIRVRRWGQFQGEYMGFMDIHKYKTYRQNMSIQYFRKWQKLPYS